MYFTGCFAKTLVEHVGMKNLKSWASVNRGAIILSRYVYRVPFSEQGLVMQKTYFLHIDFSVLIFVLSCLVLLPVSHGLDKHTKY